MTKTEDRTAILFVCMGNICRSPTAEGVFRHLAREAGLDDMLLIESAGTHAYHAGEPADRRATEAALRRGFSLDGIRARRVCDEDYERFDLILAMDDDNLQLLEQQAPATSRAKLRRFLSYGNAGAENVPDPYYGGASGFERVLDLVEDAARGLLEAVSRYQRIGTGL